MIQIGDRFGKLTLERILPSRLVGKTYKVFWECKCECGNLKEYQANNVKCGNSLSCGCTKGGGHNLKEPGMANAKYLFGNYRIGAKQRGLIFELDFEDFIQITQKDCYFCGKKPSQIFDAKDKAGNSRLRGAYFYNGIDRIDNNAGYTQDNCVPCCFVCNRAKCDMSRDEFLDWIDLLLKHHVKTNLSCDVIG